MHEDEDLRLFGNESVCRVQNRARTLKHRSLGDYAAGSFAHGRGQGHVSSCSPEDTLCSLLSVTS